MLGRHGKLTLGALSGADNSKDCVLVGTSAVYRKLMDPSLDTCNNVVPRYDCGKHTNKKAAVARARLEKSESEDSGVELPPNSPFGSEKSYGQEEPESIDVAYPEEQKHLRTSARKKSDSFVDSSSEETDIVDLTVPLKIEKFKVHRYGDITLQRERDMSGLPHKLEQAVLRSRRQRLSSREPTQNRTNWSNRHYQGSLKDQRRGTPLFHKTRSPTRCHNENEEHDPLHLPGDGLRYLENLCDMLEQIAELQKQNQRLQHEKRQSQERLHNIVLFNDSCQCSSSHSCRVTEGDAPDGSHPCIRTWENQIYRKRASSHTGILRNFQQQPSNRLIETDKTQPHFVSVPNLQENNAHSRDQRKIEVSQWDKMKDLIFKLSRKASSSSVGSASASTRHNYRSQNHSDAPSNAPRRRFLPSLVIRPSRKQGQQYR
ncbi:uncharacterized protein LOC134601087 isoform X1 [Pelobates fuscus]|uniref:uncharacterized protein LOC134601087 isoform X1 n=2 Tax=Pelobates fuscus TaxID=191477 RepID=UPI002FE45A43